MEVQIKKTIKAGNSSAVVLPKAWLNKEVRVELIKKTSEIILYDVLEILKKHIELKEIIGIYLVGSYARGEESGESDIDVLVITKGIDKEVIKEGIYNILLVSYQLLYQKLEQDLFPIAQMIKEARPLLNSDYIENLEIKVTQKNVKWYLDTTEEKLILVKKYIEEARSRNKKALPDKIAYTLILRIRTLYIIKKLIENKNYSSRDFINLIKRISKGKNSYESYLAVKNNLEEKGINIEEAERLYKYLEKELKEVKGLVKKKLR